MTPREPAPVEHLYGAYAYFSDENTWVRLVTPFRITKRTAKRIYYIRDARDSTGKSGSVDRATLESEGVVTNRGRSYHAVDYRLYATHEAALASITPEPAQPPTVAQLRREMADAHPDRGGTNASFRAAHARYEAAKQHAARKGATTPGEPQ